MSIRVERYDIPQRTPAQWTRPSGPERLRQLIAKRKPEGYEVAHWYDRGGHVEVHLQRKKPPLRDMDPPRPAPVPPSCCSREHPHPVGESHSYGHDQRFPGYFADPNGGGVVASWACGCEHKGGEQIPCSQHLYRARRREGGRRERMG